MAKTTRSYDREGEFPVPVDINKDDHGIVFVPIERRLQVGGIEIDPNSNVGGIETEVLRQITAYVENEIRKADGEPITDCITFRYQRYVVEVRLGEAVE